MQLTVGACPVACEVREGRTTSTCSSLGAQDPASGRSCATICGRSKSRQRPPELPSSCSYLSIQLSSSPHSRPHLQASQTNCLSEAHTLHPELMHAIDLDSSKGNRSGNCRVYPPFPTPPETPKGGNQEPVLRALGRGLFLHGTGLHPVICGLWGILGSRWEGSHGGRRSPRTCGGHPTRKGAG